MKRKIALLLAFATCVSQATILANDYEITKYSQIDNLIFETNTEELYYTITYNDIHTLVTNDNKTIQSNDMLLDYIQNPPGKQEGLLALWNASQGLTSVITMVNSAKNSLNPESDNYFAIYMALTAGGTALELSKADLEAQLDSLAPTDDDDMKSYIFQFDSIKQQITWGAQSLYMAYMNLNLTLQELEISKKLLEDTITSLETRYQLGQISQLDLLNVQSNLISIESALITLQYEQDKLLYDLNMLLGRDYNSPLSIADDIVIDYDYLKEIDVEEDFQSLLDNNYNFYNLKESLSDAHDTNKSLSSTASQNAYDMALLNLQIEQSSMKSSFVKLHSAIDEKQRLIDVEEQLLDNKDMNLIATKLKYDLGNVSLDVLNSAINEYETQYLKVITAQYSLFIAIEQYKWATNGMITG